MASLQLLLEFSLLPANNNLLAKEDTLLYHSFERLNREADRRVCLEDTHGRLRRELSRLASRRFAERTIDRQIEVCHLICAERKHNSIGCRGRSSFLIVHPRVFALNNVGKCQCFLNEVEQLRQSQTTLRRDRTLLNERHFH